MVVIIALGLGAGLGIGLWALIVGVFPPRPTLGAVLARVTTSPSPPPILPTGEAGVGGAAGQPVRRAAAGAGVTRCPAAP